ncbi:MAG: type II toxin-antitoxin system RelE/ParE family toxin [bacterium]
MIIKIDSSFVKDTKKIKDRQLLAKIADCIEEIQMAGNFKQIKNVKKLHGEENFYRIRLGEYRLGIRILENTVEFIRVLHRKDIYKHFSH